ncbi:MAG: HAD-IIIC family phosphatase [Acidobacteria bacterium]|nr:HAD-IIIC family phosphatase [Acidobacteriota bacterium]
MTLRDALLITQKQGAEGEPFRALLACGYSPLHVQTFLTAHLMQRLPGRPVRVTTGRYGDLTGTIELAAATEEPFQAVAVSIEWPDLDPRLGYRRLGGWSKDGFADIVTTVRTRLDWIAQAIAKIPASTQVAIAGPTLPPAPAGGAPGWLESTAELELSLSLQEFLLAQSKLGRLIVSPSWFDRGCAPEARFDARSEISAGFPFTRDHASLLSEALARLMLPESPKKGLITDLDDTFWKGIVGEIGADAIQWDLDGGGQIHGLYQQLLASLGEQGTLLAIASKNELSNVHKAFERTDMRAQLDAFFPVEVHWQPKSGSVSRILQAWNVGADSVVFIDDSPAELGEVQAAHPEVECILFPKNDPAEALRLLQGLRDRFGKRSASAEDAIRLQSLRSAAELREASGSDDALDRFLSTADGKITLDAASDDARTLELVNKTNQFNLNGVRYTERDWAESRQRPGAFTFSALYEDKFGPLGKIAVVHGTALDSKAVIDVWVMSCRAFSRRIEYHVLDEIFRHFAVDSIEFRFEPTAKNKPLAQLLSEWPRGPQRLSKEELEGLRPALYHQVRYVGLDSDDSTTSVAR